MSKSRSQEQSATIAEKKKRKRGGALSQLQWRPKHSKAETNRRESLEVPPAVKSATRRLFLGRGGLRAM